MNGQLVTAGYPWVVIPVEHREEYMAALEKASVEGDVEGFVRFIGEFFWCECCRVRENLYFCGEKKKGGNI